ncbi:MAG: NUDIX hydrolase [Gaiellales bacterium]
MRPDEATTVYEGRWLRVALERWGEREREIVERPDVLCVVPIDREGTVTLVRQLREPARRELIELPAGRIEPGEEPLACARRELAEETGLRGGRWRQVRSWWSSPGFCRERVHLFVAEALERDLPAPTDDERIELVRWRLDEVAARLGELEDAKTLTGLALYLGHRS